MNLDVTIDACLRLSTAFQVQAEDAADGGGMTGVFGPDEYGAGRQAMANFRSARMCNVFGE